MLRADGFDSILRVPVRIENYETEESAVALLTAELVQPLI